MNRKSNLFLCIFVILTAIIFQTFVVAQEYKIETKYFVYYEQNKNIKGYFATPTAKGKSFPAIILIHEQWGLNDYIKENARNFAKQGYVALAVDLYNGQVATEASKARELAGSVRQDKEGAFSNLENAVAFIKKQKNTNENKIASIGWCFGGGWSYQMAKNNLGVKASIIYYGSFNPEDDLSKMRATILGHFAEKDRGIRLDNVKEFQVKLKTLSGDHEVYIYPNSQHAFANPGRDIYDKDAAELAWKRTLEFLKKFL